MKKMFCVSSTLLLSLFLFACCPPFCPKPDDEPVSTLSRPTVSSPLYECATAVSVSGFVPGAQIDIYANGSTHIGGGTSDSPWGQRFKVNPSLIAGQVITATQKVGNDISAPSNGVTVESFMKGHPEGLPVPTLDVPIYDCGGAIGVRNLADGGLLEVFADSNLVGDVNGCGPGQWLFVNPVFSKGQKVHARETLCTDIGPNSNLETVVEAPSSLPTPIVESVYEGGKYGIVDNITNGAMTEVYNGVQKIAGHYCSGGSQIFRLNPQPAAGDSLTAVQSLCDVKSDPSDPTVVIPCSELPKPYVHDVCIGDTAVSVSNTVIDARIRVYNNTNLVGDGGSNTVNIMSPAAPGDKFTATQALGVCVSPHSDVVEVNKFLCSIPPYSPGFWNDGGAIGSVEWENNCYNYGNNKRTDTFAQPGRASGYVRQALTCSEVSRAAESDGIRPLPSSGECPCREAKIALVVAPGSDYHWYRLDSNNMWSHKPGHTPATNLDNSSNPISNPETADRGSYTDFCGYFCSCSDEAQGQGHENIL